jgi:hypothetical protein
MKGKTMKTLTGILATAVLALGISFAHAEKVTPGPKGGRLLENESPRAEFFVEKDKTVTITFYDANLKPVSVTDQTVVATAEAKSGKTKIEFQKKGDVLVSKTPLPEGEGYNVVVQLRSKPDAKPQNFRIKYDTAPCAKCKRPEYACICEE